MKEITIYQCEICNTQYDDSAAAASCEEYHQTIEEIVGTRYKTKAKYPESITVLFNDGKELKYRKE